jgi:glucose/arabinose dehydrogenase
MTGEPSTPPVAEAPATTSESQATPTLAPTEAPTPEEVSTLPDPSIYNWQSVADGLERPVGLFNAGDGSGRLFVLEQPGTIRIIKEGEVLPTPFLDIVDRVGSGGSEQGLLGLAFHPNYAENGHFYVNYTDRNGNTVIARFSVSDNPDQADPASEVQLLGVEQPFGNHNGGMLAFGPDGYLYLGLGDGGSAGDPFGNAQSLSTLLGKILRIDVDDGDPYAIPPDNPFASGGGRPEIWAYGLRNPWRFSFDLLTNDLYIGDVGQNQWEEIDFLPAGSPGGANFGWNYREGAHPYEGSPPAGLNLIDPVAEYDHSQGCSVTGGYVYRGQDLPDWSGVYLYGDYCSGLVWGLLHLPDGSWQNARLFESGARITSFGQDQAGEIYLVDYQGGIYRLGKK